MPENLDWLGMLLFCLIKIVFWAGLLMLVVGVAPMAAFVVALIAIIVKG
jgi:hypothetical protein